MNNYPQSIEEFLAAPYFERQFVSFFDDGSSETGKKGYEPLHLYIALGGSTALVVGFNLHSIYRLLKRFWRIHRNGAPVTLLPWSWAAHLNFPFGPPRQKLLYAGHPADPPTYIPITEFHRFSFEHKVQELVSILTHLGAKQITVQCVHRQGTDVAAALKAAVPQVKIEVLGENEREGDNGNRMVTRVELEGNNNPCLPTNLLWYRHEPTWQMLVEARGHGLKNCSLYFHYNDDYGINSDFKVYAEKAGFQMRGGFEEYKATIWQIEVLF